MSTRPLFVKVNSEQKQAKDFYLKKDGNWVPGRLMYTKVDGEWQHKHDYRDEVILADATCTTKEQHRSDCPCGECGTPFYTGNVDPNNHTGSIVNGGTTNVHTKYNCCNAVVSSSHSYSGSPSYSWSQGQTTSNTSCTASIKCNCGYTKTASASSIAISSHYDGTCVAKEQWDYRAYFSESSLFPSTTSPGWVYGSKDPDNHVESKTESSRTPAKCNATGTIYYTYPCCNADGGTSTIEKNPNNHAQSKTESSRTPATCTAAGTIYYKYPCCNVSAGSSTIPATGHSWGSWSSISDSQHKRTCSNNSSHTETGSHSFSTTLAATCTVDGSKKCGTCNKVLAIPATGHTETTISGTAATCTTSGKTSGKKCSVCGKITQEQTTIPATGHSYGTVSKSWGSGHTSCTASTTCANCGNTISETKSATKRVAANATCKTGEKYDYSVTFANTILGSATCPDYHYGSSLNSSNHEGSKVEKSRTNATCTSSGTIYYEWSCCKASAGTGTIPATGHSGSKTLRSSTAATCTTSGSKVYEYSGCHCYHSTETIPATGHTETTISGTAATCQATGLTDGKKCSVCGATTKAQETIAKVSHNYTKSTSCSNIKQCQWCTATSGSHNFSIAATCLSAAKCTGCSETSGSKNPSNHASTCIWNKRTTATLCRTRTCGLQDTSHSFSITKEATCNSIGYKTCSDCGYEEIIPATGQHTEIVYLTGTAATCTTYGKTDGKKCSVCGFITQAQTTISKLPHTEETIPGTAATCTTYGKTDGKKCSVCGTITQTQKTISMLPHTEETIPGTAATCTSTGLTDGKKCSVCGAITQTQKTIFKLPHTEETIPGTAATCTTSGKTDGKKCSVCGATTKAQETIAKDSSNHSNIISVKLENICKKCSGCGVVTTASHNWTYKYTNSVCRECSNCGYSQGHSNGNDYICDRCGYEK